MPITKRVQYRYDSVRNKIGMTDADGGLHTYTYDVMRRLTGVINPLGERTTYAYDLNGRRTSVQLANGTRTSYVYDLGSRVQSVHTLKSDDSTVSKFEYEYDGNGRRTSVLEADGSRVTWTYDRISQVTSEWRTGTNPHRHTFTYDSVGNRTLKIEDGARTTLVYDASNQLLTSEDAGGTTTFSYDGNGNQTVVQKPNGDRTTQVWDYENRLIKTIQPSGGVTSMAYDADGLRLKLEEPTGTKLFVWDDQNYLAETDAAGTTQAAFTTEPSTYGSLISHRKAGATTTYHFDALGSTRALTDASEAVLKNYNYTAFGTLLGTPTLHTPFLWGGMVGYYWDAALATQYIRARHYQPAIARWISLDPIGFAGGDANLFRYVGNSPTSGGMGRWIRLTLSALGKWQLGIARNASSSLSFNRTHAGRIGSFSPNNSLPGGHNMYSQWFAFRNTDPTGFDPSVTIKPKFDWDNWSCLYDIYDDGNHNSTYPGCIAISMEEYYSAAQVKEGQRVMINNQGCVGICWVSQHGGDVPSDILKSARNSTRYPEYNDTTNCYPENPDPNTIIPCKDGQDEFRFYVDGPNALPPGAGPYRRDNTNTTGVNETVTTRLPHPDGHYDYKSFSHGMCVFMNHAPRFDTPGDPARIYLCPGGCPPKTYANRLLCITCRGCRRQNRTGPSGAPLPIRPHRPLSE